MGRHSTALKIRERLGRDLRDILQELYADNEWSLKRVGAELGVSYQTVYAYLLDYAIPVRPRSMARALAWEQNAEYRNDVQRNMKRVSAEFRDKARKHQASAYRARPRRFEQMAIDHLDARGASYDFQVVVGRYIVDFVLPEHGLILEIALTQSLRVQPPEKVRERYEYLISQGYRVSYIIHSGSTSAFQLGLRIDAAIAGGP